MIFEWDTSEALLEAADRNILGAAVAELTRSHRFGHHLVIIGRQTSQWLLRNVQLGVVERATLERIIAEFTQTGGLRAQAIRKVRIVTDKTTAPTRVGGVVEVGLVHVSRPYLCDRAALVVENAQNDGRFYLGILQVLARRIVGYPICYEVMHGGGEGVVAVLKDVADQPRLASAIIDSDRGQPADDNSLKCRDASALVTRLPYVEVLCLPCREVENLIPLSIVADLPCANAEGAQLARLERIADAEERGGVPRNERMDFFYDMKKGRRSSRESEWFNGRIAMGGKGKYNGFGGNILSQLLDSGAILSRFFRVVEGRAWTDAFGVHFEVVLWTGLSAPRQYV